MKKDNLKKSSLLAKYSLQYEKKPRSRVFAPLAQTYRQLGMYEEALKILREGIKHHPEYTLGYIVLAQVYFDKENYEVAYSTLRPFVSKSLENIVLQKTFAQICVNLGYLEEALETFKCLLLINPKDEEVASQVKLLEDDLLVPDEEDIPTGFIEKREKNFSEEEDWVQVNFGKEDKRAEDNIEDWAVEEISASPLESFKSDIESGNFEVQEHNLDDKYFHEDHDVTSEEVIGAEESKLSQNNEKPIITHTLVDLYCSQGYEEKAIEILNDILELHPNDEASLEKREELIKKLNTSSSKLEIVEEVSELDIKRQKLESLLNKFSNEINQRAEEINS